MTMTSVQTRAPVNHAPHASFVSNNLLERPIATSRASIKTQHAGSAEQTSVTQTDLVPSLLAISKAMRALRGIKLAALGFNNGQDELLMVIPEGGMAVNEIASALTIRPSTVSKMTDRLIEKGCMERVRDPRDRRLTVVRLTPAGMEAREQVTAVQADMEAELVRMMDVDTLEARQACLRDCADILKARLMRLR